MKIYKKLTLALMTVALLFSGQASAQQQRERGDSVMNPGVFNAPASTNRGPGAVQGTAGTTVVSKEQVWATCPAGYTTPWNTTTYVDRQRDVINYYNGTGLTGVQYGAWEDMDTDCAMYQHQVVGCPPGQAGQINQNRLVTTGDGGLEYGTWNTTSNTCAYYYIETRYDRPVYECGAGYFGQIHYQRSYEYWSDGSERNSSGYYEVYRNCVPRNLQFVTPFVKFNPPRSNKGIFSINHTQTYGPYSVQQFDIVMTIRYHVYVISNGQEYVCSGGDNGSCFYQEKLDRRSQLEIWANTDGLVNVNWDRDYASFGNKYLSNGYVSWDNVANNEWTDNESHFVINIWR